MLTDGLELTVWIVEGSGLDRLVREGLGGMWFGLGGECLKRKSIASYHK